MERTMNVYVFGAGASVHVGGPLTKDFLHEGFSLLCNNEIYEISKESFFEVAQLIDALYGSNIEALVAKTIRENYVSIPSQSIPLVTIEELLTYVDLALDRQEHWLPFFRFQMALKDFIFETLDSLVQGYSSDVYTPMSDGTYDHRRNCYDKLIDYIIDVNESNSFITFNYDLFLDTAIAINNHRLLGDYNVDFTHINNFDGYKRIAEGKRTLQDVDILKLHGSLNWAHCPLCNELHLSFHQNYRSILKSTCNCGNRLVPVLIPPTLRKNIEQDGLKGIWDRAEHVLTNADKLTIIGYSFPDADNDAKWLFKRSLANNPKKPTLTLIEPSEEVRNKIAGFFGNSVGEIKTFNKFESYCEAGHL